MLQRVRARAKLLRAIMAAIRQNYPTITDLLQLNASLAQARENQRNARRKQAKAAKTLH